MLEHKIFSFGRQTRSERRSRSLIFQDVFLPQQWQSSAKVAQTLYLLWPDPGAVHPATVKSAGIVRVFEELLYFIKLPCLDGLFASLFRRRAIRSHDCLLRFYRAECRSIASWGRAYSGLRCG